MRYAFVAHERTHYPLRMLCRLLEVSVSGFHDWRHRQARPDPDATVRAELRAIHAESRNTYGRPRLVRALRTRSHAVGHKRVARLMREEGLHGKVKGRFTPRTTDSQHRRPVAENRLDRQFAVDHPMPAWVGDITYIPTREGWLYLATVIDLRTRQVLGYSLSERMPDDLVQQAFLNAWSASPVKAGVLFHSDRGSQYASGDFTRTLADHGFEPSMSRKGNCWDNAVMERFFLNLKMERVWQRRYANPAEAIVDVTHYIVAFYNTHRLHSTLGYRSPADYEKAFT